MNSSLLEQFQGLHLHGAKGLAVLLDPDKLDESSLVSQLAVYKAAGVDFFFVGGSLLTNDHIHHLVPLLKAQTDIPVILFPGSIYQIVPQADGIFFLSLISGRNPDLLIGNHVVAAPILAKSELEVMATGYILVESGRTTTVHYMSNTLPIPHDKPDVAACTALAGEYLGLKLLYMDGGSGAMRPISAEMVRTVREKVSLPLIVGGGIRSGEDAERLWQAGADVLVVGNALEKDTEGKLIFELAEHKHRFFQWNG
ncbi:MAG: geranylgeranylglyceryl/heptaprenylglyceryl phosphate synthase [Bacteroidota bacterium]